MTIRTISSTETLELRSRILRAGAMKPEQCLWSHDNDAKAFHLGCFDGEKLVGVATFFPEEFDGQEAYRLRGMAVETAYQKCGVGSMLFEKGVELLNSLGCKLLWFNARSSACRFYEKHGCSHVSDLFFQPDSGWHVKMIRKLP